MNRQQIDNNRNRAAERPRDESGRFESESEARAGRDRRYANLDDNWQSDDNRRYSGNRDFDTYYGGGSDDFSQNRYDSQNSDRIGQNQSRQSSGGYQDWGRDRSSNRDWNAGSQTSGQRYGQQGQYGGRSEANGGQYGSGGQMGNGGQYGGSSSQYGSGSQYGGQYRGAGSNYSTSYSGSSSWPDEADDRQRINVGRGGNQSGSYSQQGGGQHAGKGPKGYRRSDDRILEDVNEALAQHAEIDPSEIEVKVSSGEVTLTGTVSERHFKRMAEDIAERCSGVQDVKNEIRVQRENATGSSEQQSTKGKMPNGSTGGNAKTSESKTA